MAIFERKDPTEEPQMLSESSNVESLNTLLSIVKTRYTFTLNHYSEATKQKALGSISNMLVASSMALDPQMLLEEYAISRLWMDFFDTDIYARQFLMSVHSQFITSIGTGAWEQLVESKSYGLYYITMGSQHADVNKIHSNANQISSLFKLYPWLLTYLLIGDITIFLGELLSE